MSLDHLTDQQVVTGLISCIWHIWALITAWLVFMSLVPQYLAKVMLALFASDLKDIRDRRIALAARSLSQAIPGPVYPEHKQVPIPGLPPASLGRHIPLTLRPLSPGERQPEVSPGPIHPLNQVLGESGR